MFRLLSFLLILLIYSKIANHFLPSQFGTLGHSDGDPVLHAITDAILGACSMGDIGEKFSDKNKINYISLYNKFKNQNKNFKGSTSFKFIFFGNPPTL